VESCLLDLADVAHDFIVLAGDLSFALEA